ncbi:MAG TPA: SPOR domain-containing protein [Woeseiaceae bacterium]|nr:SPOR domain-containing protein [Woeseiaceae bacterium]
MATKRRRDRSEGSEYPGWAWMVFGLAIGLSVAFAIYVNGRDSRVRSQPVAEEAASMREAAEEATLPQVDEVPAGSDTPPKPRFDFYNMLPNFEVIIPEQETDVSSDTAVQAVVKPGVYVLQAGSFTQHADADRRRAQLALQGIESTIQRVTIDDKTYHRVRIGPIEDLEQLNVVRSRLREADIDVLRIRLGD